MTKPQTLCLFCTYFEGAELPEYVRVYLIEVNRHFSEVWLLTNHKELHSSTLEFLQQQNIRLKQFVNEGFDFGMWSKAMQELSVADYSEVALVNDSCVLFRRLDHVMTVIRESDWDYAGLVSSRQVQWHIQSFFVVMRKPVLKDVLMYFQQMGIQKEFANVIVNYEVGLSAHLQEKNYKVGTVFSVNHDPTLNPSFVAIKTLIENGFPLIKRKLLTGAYRPEELRGLLIRNFAFDPDHYIDLVKKEVKDPLLDVSLLRASRVKLRFYSFASSLLSIPFIILRGIKRKLEH